ncbi:MFS transporter [Mycolicibacterium litorale]|uniref:MFS transporter n=1 Tax=Mycolicibacterium litorale TaxID=758802 RepID=A0AAD1IG63_9MYCO|nr:MFS transporter [Mycolicibacterium litorale]MCV7414020.1 MFS transporter [Mycolicibacterium litorale]TDY03096.1 sugar phosphate permease [Mycolicibacterium litorale]BBY14889.1 MFS transporter [Mycolicibacterium litorale]
MIARPYYGWLMVGGLGLTELVSWGVLIYAFSVLVVPMRAELGWSLAELNAAYTTGVVLSGLLALPVGRLLHTHGARGVMTAGSVATVVMLLLWSTVDSLWVFFCVFVIGGVAMATTLYEPAFAVTTAWFDRDRPRAVLVLTIFGGLASVVFVPLTGALVAWAGWREAVVVLAVIAGGIGLPVHAMLVRRRPADLGMYPDGTHDPPRQPQHYADVSTRSVLRTASFRWLTVCMVLSTAAKFAVSVVLVAYLTSRGYSLSRASLAAGGVGLFQVGGRLVVTALRNRVPQYLSTAGIFVCQGAALAVLLWATGTGTADTAVTAAFVVVFGLGYGLEALLRGTLVAAYYGDANYPRINGVLGAYVTGARAVGPLLAGLAVTALNGYEAVFLAAGLMCAASGIVLVLAERSRRVEVTRHVGGA